MKNLSNQDKRNLSTIIDRMVILLGKNPLMNIDEAFEVAFKEEQLFLKEMVDQNSERSVKALNQIRKNVFGIINILN